MSKTQRDESTIADYNTAKQSIANSNAGTLLYIKFSITVITTEREAQRMCLFLFRDDRLTEDDSEMVNT